MKSMVFVVIFACAAINFIRLDASSVEIAQVQQISSDIMVASR